MRMRGSIAVAVCAVALCSCGDHSAASPSAPSTPAAGNPPGTGIGFMMGTVSDTAFRPLAAATVEVLDGPQAGLTTTADAAGHFSLSGTFDETTRFRATKSGHVTSTRTLQPFCAPCHPNWWINFSLEVLTPPVNMAGEYTATFIADNVSGKYPTVTGFEETLVMATAFLIVSMLTATLVPGRRPRHREALEPLRATEDVAA